MGNSQAKASSSLSSSRRSADDEKRMRRKSKYDTSCFPVFFLTTTKKTTRSHADDDDDDDDDDEHDSHSGDHRGSTRSGASASSASSSYPSLRENMMRERKNRDPFLYYEVVQVLGVGSMGSVSKVKKRQTAVGGSARDTGVRHGPCYFLRSMPVFGGLFQACMGKARKPGSTIRSSWWRFSDDSSATGRSSGRGLLDRRQDLLEGRVEGSSRMVRIDETVDLATSNRSTTSVITPSDGTYSLYYALKSIHLDRLTDDTLVKELRNEIEILKRLDHPHIVRPIETFEFRKQMYIVMELCSGGDLYTRDPYTEDQAARIVSSILSAVAYMHDCNITHRDLKYENIMFASSSPLAEIKLIDFGLSKKYGPEDPIMTDSVGTIYTMAPEVFKGDYTSKADLWSIGVLAYMLLSSQMPFYGRKRSHVVKKIIGAQYEFRGRRWKMVSQQAKYFVADLLQLNPDDRPTADEALQATWLNRRFAATTRTPDADVLDNVQATLETFSHYSELKKLALMVVAHKSTSEEIGFLRKVFQKFDKKSDGMISFSEFKEALEEYGYTDEEMENMFHGIDLDKTGKIRYTEFLAATIEAHGALNEERLAEAFDRLDSDDSGYISTKNLREILGKEVPQADIEKIIKDADLTHDHKISYDEFLALWDLQQEDMRTTALSQIAYRRAQTTGSSSNPPSLRTDNLQDMSILEETSSEMSSLPDDDLSYMGHTQFYEEKRMSERRTSERSRTKDVIFEE